MEIRFVPYLLIMLAILSGLIKLLDWHDERLDTKCANLMHKDVLFEKEPEKEQLLAIARNKLFKQTLEKFSKSCAHQTCNIRPCTDSHRENHVTGTTVQFRQSTMD